LLGSFSVQGENNVDTQHLPQSNSVVEQAQTNLEEGDETDDSDSEDKDDLDEADSVVEDEDAKKKNKKRNKKNKRCKKRRSVVVYLKKQDVDWNKRDILGNLEHFQLPAESIQEDEDEEEYDEAELQEPIYINFDMSHFLGGDDVKSDDDNNEIQQSTHLIANGNLDLISAKKKNEQGKDKKNKTSKKKNSKEIRKYKNKLKRKYCGCSCSKSYMFHYINGSTETFPFEKDIRTALEQLYSREEIFAQTYARAKRANGEEDKHVEILLDDEKDVDENDQEVEEDEDDDLNDIEGLTEAEKKKLTKTKRRKLRIKIKKQCKRKCKQSGIPSEWVHIYF